MKSLPLALALVAGCATRGAPPATSVDPPPEGAAESQDAAETPDEGAWPGISDAERTRVIGGWESEARQDHPLVGIRWGVAEGRPLTRDEVQERARRHRFVLLGEKHDNPDHHRLQARMLGTLADPAAIVVYEMLDDGDADAIPTPWATNSLGATPRLALGEWDEADRVAAAVGWDESGWPDWAMYRRVFAVPIKYGMALVPGHPERDVLKAVMMEGLETLPAETRTALKLERTYDDAQRAAVEEHIQEAHCGMAPPSVVPMMTRGQRVKDAWMARALEQHALPEMAGTPVPRPAGFLIAGGGHTRPDRGVPMFLSGADDAFVIAFVEVPRTGEEVVPADFAGQADVVWFTPRVDDDDPCVKYAEELKNLGPVDK